MGVPSDIPVGKLIYTVFNSILEVFLTCLAGYVLARKGILDKKTQKKLNHLNVSLFTPALVISKVAFFLTPQKLLSLWIIPISFIVITLISLLVSLLLSLPFKLKRSQRNFAIAASMFMNSNSLPIALMQSLVGSVDGLKWEKNGSGEDNQDAMMGRALTYLVVASTMGMVLRWSFGVRLLAAADDPQPQPSSAEAAPLPSSNLPQPPALRSSTDQVLLSSASTVVSLTPCNSRSPSFDKPPLSPIGGPAEGSTLRLQLPHPHATRNMAAFRSFPNSPMASQEQLTLPPLSPLDVSSRRESMVTFVGVESDRKDGEESPVSPVSPPASRPPSPSPPSQPASLPRRIFNVIITKLRSCHKAIAPMLTPPLIASLVSLLIALITPVQHFLLKEEFKPVRGMLEKVGAVSIPITLIVLGGYFVEEKKGDAAKAERDESMIEKGKRLVGDVKGFFTRQRSRDTRDEESATAQAEKERAEEKEKEKAERKGETTTVVISMVSRMILTPAALMPLVVVIATSQWAGVFDDPIFILSLLLLLCSPPALTLAQITQAVSGDAFERLISRTIFWSYLVMTPAVMVGVVVGGVVLARV